MKRLLPYVALAASVFCFFLLTDRARAYPKPSVNRIAWELDFQHGAPTRITVKAPGADAPKAYWYMAFTVTNLTQEEQLFLPVIELLDEKGNVTRSDNNIPKEVFEAIKQREGKKLMEPLAKVEGRLLVGADQAKDSVAIWPEPVERMGTFSIFVNGLSGEAVWYKDGKETPAREMKWYTKDAPKSEEAGIILRKTLEIDYQVPGDEFYQGRDRVIQKDERWVMR
jgi:hypothetical protein